MRTVFILLLAFEKIFPFWHAFG
ncbi:MAG: hypothetical protein ACD_9C00073G0012, partial [uncultured bacterium]